ncbi:MAG TPA: hypothetical protein VMZ66_10745 [Aeromicrobium sp.]|nr:hypothetical protein [Aeromicrobium sp.]
MNTRNVVQFSLRQESAQPLDVCLRRLGPRWVAEVSGPVVGIGLGLTARTALTAALQPLGHPAIRALMADLGLLEPSVAVLELEAATASA